VELRPDQPGQATGPRRRSVGVVAHQILTEGSSVSTARPPARGEADAARPGRSPGKVAARSRRGGVTRRERWRAV
jgi:hypothetical protein